MHKTFYYRSNLFIARETSVPYLKLLIAYATYGEL